MVMTESNVRLNNLVESGVEVLRGNSNYQPMNPNNRQNDLVIAGYKDGGRESVMMYGEVEGQFISTGVHERALEILKSGGVSPILLTKPQSIVVYIHTLDLPPTPELPDGESFQFLLPSLKYFDRNTYGHLQPFNPINEAKESAFHELDNLRSEERDLLRTSLDDLPWGDYPNSGIRAKGALIRSFHSSAADVWVLYKASVDSSRKDPELINDYGPRLIDTTRKVFSEFGIELPGAESKQ